MKNKYSILFHKTKSSDYLCTTPILRWLIKAMLEKNYLVATRKIFCSYNILSCSHDILSCSHDILYYSLKILFCSHKKYSLFPQHIILGQAHNNVAGLNKFCESSCLHLYKHYTTDEIQIQNKRRPESRKYRIYVWERERVCLIIILCPLYHMFMFVLPLVRVMGERWDLTKLDQLSHTYV